MEKNPNRISVSLGQKINTGNYTSRDIHVSFSTDCEPGETPEQAYMRAAEFVKKLMNAELKLAQPQKP